MKLNSECQKSMMLYIEEKNIMEPNKYSHKLELTQISRESILTAMVGLGYTRKDAEYTFIYLQKNDYFSIDESSHENVTDIIDKGHAYLAQIREKKQHGVESFYKDAIMKIAFVVKVVSSENNLLGGYTREVDMPFTPIIGMKIEGGSSTFLWETYTGDKLAPRIQDIVYNIDEEQFFCLFVVDQFLSNSFWCKIPDGDLRTSFELSQFEVDG